MSVINTIAADELIKVEETFHKVEYGWQKVERCRNEQVNLLREDYPLDGRGDQEGQRLTFFGNKQPAANQFLLYYAPNWDSNVKTPPILLIMGANDNADRAWANPGEHGYCGVLACPNTGLMQTLVAKGYRVFAINFAHKQGDNLIWAQQIQAAITRIKSVTKTEKVDLIAWSKGAFAARLYVSNLKPVWGSDYRDDIGKLILLGSPNLGSDYAFRHGSIFNSLLFPNCGSLIKINGPAPHIAVRCLDKWVNYPEYSIYTTSAGNFFPGQKQMLRRFDAQFPIPQTDPDWQTTYLGGKGVQAEGMGIDKAIEQGSLVDKMRSNGVPKSITTYLLAGSAANIPFFHNEHSGPSDGLVFVASAIDIGGIGKVGGVRLIEKINHLQLGWDSAAVAQIQQWLAE